MTKSPKNAVGPQLVQLRTARGWSQQEFASKCQLRAWDISRDIVARIELQTRCVTDIELLKLASVLKVPVQILLPEQRSK